MQIWNNMQLPLGHVAKIMLWTTHRELVKRFSEELGIFLSPEVYRSFMDGIIAPDQWQDYPHHYGKSGKNKTVSYDVKRMLPWG